MEKTQPPDQNLVQVSGLLQNLRQRWTPDGSLAVIAEVLMERPPLGPVRAEARTTQPMPVRATGKVAEAMSSMQEQHVEISGCLRRRYYSRDGEPCWGQVEIWVDSCHPLKHLDASGTEE